MLGKIIGKIKYNKKALYLTVFFIATLLYFVLANSYYIPSSIVLETKGIEGTTAQLYWDSGIGFNEREAIEFVPYKEEEFADKLHTVQIASLDEVNKESQGKDVWLNRIFTNEGQEIDRSTLLIPDNTYINSNNYIAFNKTGKSITFKQKFKTLNIEFVKHQWAGKVQVTIDGKSQTMDLFSKQTMVKKATFNKGALPVFVINTIPLPQLKVKAIKLVFSKLGTEVKSVSVLSDKTTSIQPTKTDGLGYLYESPSLATKSFNWILFAVQLGLAIILTWLVFELWSYLERVNKSNAKELLKYLFVDKQHYVFWIMFAVSFWAFATWLLGHWPAIMTVDSYHFTWREIKTLTFTNITPWVYNFYVLALTQFYDSPVTVSIFQVLATSLLGSYIFYYVYKNGGNKYLTFGFFTLFIFSIPVGIYNITIWKDIPFNTVMLFWGFLIFHLYYQRKYLNKVNDFNLIRLFFLALAFIFLATVRHNGQVFLLLIPVLLVIFKLIPRKSIAIFLGFSVVIYSLTVFATPHISKTDPNEVKKIFERTYRFGPLAAIYSSRFYYSPAPDKDKDLINKWLTDEELKNLYTPVTQVDTAAIPLQRWALLKPEDQQRLNQLYFIRSLQNPHIFIADRLTMFLGTMGLSDKVFITTNELVNSSDKSFWRPVETYKFALEPKSQLLYQVQEFIIMAAKSFKGNIPISMFIFNTLPAAVFFIFVLFLHYRYPASAIYSLIFLYSLPFMFIALSTAEWRYFYFLLLSSFFIVPLMSIEHRARK